jgi:hypothetical protein
MDGNTMRGSELEQVAGSCEHGNEPSVSIKGGEFLVHLGDIQLLKMTQHHGVSSLVVT